ncbi:MAG: TIM barrel protein [Spirochaetes bacterium]|uniref:TIM barrel protein n=1 Tax=Candidatus Ornithospirochaeta stercoripullorum TaxID=2840899 RepID=A0A9D9E0K5_9SPIO|nr:TIM barrel protein [Candidatus Ornithospirochaeta stercoripullorum]
MTFGLLTAILEEWNYKEMIDTVSEIGYECVEVACWPKGKGERRYAGTSHIDTENLDKAAADEILSYASAHNVKISSLAYYPNTLDPDLEKRKGNIAHLHSLIDASALLGVGMVSTFIGRDQSKTVGENLKTVKEVWPEILDHAKEKGVKIAIENCPMLFGPDEWPGGKNLFYSPDIWREVFDVLPYDNLGINFDPSHFVWQQLDYIKALYDFKEKMFHIHFKDIKLKKDKLGEAGVLAYPLSYMTPKLPGLGDVDWGAFISALTDIGYNGYAVAEIEDKAYEGSREDIIRSLKQTYGYLRNFLV